MQVLDVQVPQVHLRNDTNWDWNGDGIVFAFLITVDNALGACHKYAVFPSPTASLGPIKRRQDPQSSDHHPRAAASKMSWPTCQVDAAPVAGGVGGVGVGVAKCQTSAVVVSFVLRRAKEQRSKGAKRAEEWETVRSERERCVWNGNAHFLRPHHPTGPQPPKPPKPPKTTQTTTRSEGAKKKALLVAYRALLSGRRRRLLNRTPNESFSPCFFVCGTIEFAIWCRQTTAALARRRGGLLFLAATPGAAIRLAHCHPPETPRPYGAPWSTATPRNVYNVWLCSWFN